MSLMASENSGGDTIEYEMPKDSGQFAVRCIGAIGLGTHPNTHADAKAGAMKQECMLIWELSELMEDGRPFTVNWRGTLSLGKNANLTSKILEPWRNKVFSDTERAGFDLFKIIGVPGLLTVQHSKNGKYANVGSLIPLPEMMKSSLIDQVNPTVKFAPTDEFFADKENVKNIWPWVRKIIEASEEGKAYEKKNPGYFASFNTDKPDANAGTDVGKDTGIVEKPAVGDDDIPF